LRPFAAVDFRDLAPLATLPARDGTPLGYRSYPAGRDLAAIVVHGAAGSSVSMHAVARALQASGVSAFAVDVRGHGGSGRRGDVGHLGQLDEDLDDVSAFVHARLPEAQLVLVGFSAGGGLGLRVAAGPLGERFARFVLLAPPLGFRSPTSRPPGGRFAVAPWRFLGLSMLGALGIHAFDALPVLAFGVPPELAERMTGTYSYRLIASFGPHADAMADLRQARRPLVILVGDRDELVVAEQYEPVVHAVRPDVPVRLVPGLGHTELVARAEGLDAIRAAVQPTATAQGPLPPR
jgi:pimeloyl-ACP methyl ester carboxylesterase